MSDQCQRCGEESEDLRMLWLGCGYDMKELDIPFTQVQIQGQYKKHIGYETVEVANSEFTVPVFEPTTGRQGNHNFYTLWICKDCRAQWLTAMSHWFSNVLKPESPGTGIFVRENGTNIEVTLEEWEARHK